MVGKLTHVHPITMCFGRYQNPTHPAYGVPDNMMSVEFAEGETGYLIETGSFFPVVTSIMSLDFGEKLRRFMREYVPFGAILYAQYTSGFDPDQSYGTVKLDRYHDPVLDYRLDPENIISMRKSLAEKVGSFKTFEKTGNLQLTFARNSAGKFLVDADVDDHQGIQHAFDVLKHKFTSKDTHPFDIHQILLFFQNIDPGYALG